MYVKAAHRTLVKLTLGVAQIASTTRIHNPRPEDISGCSAKHSEFHSRVLLKPKIGVSVTSMKHLGVVWTISKHWFHYNPSHTRIRLVSTLNERKWNVKIRLVTTNLVTVRDIQMIRIRLEQRFQTLGPLTS